MKEIAYSRFATAPSPAGNTSVKLLKAVRQSGTPVLFTVLAIETKVSLPMNSEEGGFLRDEPLLNELQCLTS